MVGEFDYCAHLSPPCTAIFVATLFARRHWAIRMNRRTTSNFRFELAYILRATSPGIYVEDNTDLLLARDVPISTSSIPLLIIAPLLLHLIYPPPSLSQLVFRQYAPCLIGGQLMYPMFRRRCARKTYSPTLATRKST